MKPTPIFSIKSWIFKLHQPLPRTPRQSKQLLTLLNDSFKRQLDIIHPPVNKSQSVSRLTEEKHNALKDDPDGSRPTDKHFSSLLELPIFSASADTHKTWRSRFSNPCMIIEDAISRNNITSSLIMECLIIEQGGQQLKSGPNVQDTGRPSRNSVAIQVAAMLATTSVPENARILTDRKLMQRLTSRLVSEGHPSIPWGWLEDIFSGKLIRQYKDKNDSDSLEGWLSGSSAILNMLISCLAVKGKLHKAIDDYLIPLAQARSSSSQSTDVSIEHIQSSILKKGMRLAFKFIVYHGGFEGPAPRLFDNLLEHSLLIDKNSSSMGYHQSALLLYHPSTERAALTLFCHSLWSQGKQAWVSYFVDAYGPDFALSLVERAKTLMQKETSQEAFKELTELSVELGRARSRASSPSQENLQQGRGHATGFIDRSRFALG